MKLEKYSYVVLRHTHTYKYKYKYICAMGHAIYAHILGHVVGIPCKAFFEESVRLSKQERNEDLLRYVLEASDSKTQEGVETTCLKTLCLAIRAKSVNDGISSIGKETFFKQFSSWLEKEDFQFVIPVVVVRPSSSLLSGRPEKSFPDSCDKTKRRKTFSNHKTRFLVLLVSV